MINTRYCKLKSSVLIDSYVASPDNQVMLISSSLTKFPENIIKFTGCVIDQFHGLNGLN